MKLPDNYDLLDTIDLKNDRKSNGLIQAISIAIYVLMFIGGYFTKNLTFFAYVHYKYIIFNLLIAIFGSILYIVLHELTHAVFMKIFAPKCKLHFGFTAGMAFVGTDDYFKKGQYIIITLAPLVIWTALLLIPCLLVPVVYFWGVYFVQMFNVAGAAGDMFVTVKLLKKPNNVLITDSGVQMEIYSPDVVKKEEKILDVELNAYEANVGKNFPETKNETATLPSSDEDTEKKD
ncbi:MAG: DUF3267 domain-containing protein [Christensenellales bacterium]